MADLSAHLHLCESILGACIVPPLATTTQAACRQRGNRLQYQERACLIWQASPDDIAQPEIRNFVNLFERCLNLLLTRAFKPHWKSFQNRFLFVEPGANDK